jgi:hypothetical protein
MKIKIRILDLNTNEVQDIEREMTNEELAQFELDQAIEQSNKQKASEAAAAKAALLEKLGITEEEAKLLLS